MTHYKVYLVMSFVCKIYAWVGYFYILLNNPFAYNEETGRWRRAPLSVLYNKRYTIFTHAYLMLLTKESNSSPILIYYPACNSQFSSDNDLGTREQKHKGRNFQFHFFNGHSHGNNCALLCFWNKKEKHWIHDHIQHCLIIHYNWKPCPEYTHFNHYVLQ